MKRGLEDLSSPTIVIILLEVKYVNQRKDPPLGVMYQLGTSMGSFLESLAFFGSFLCVIDI